MGLGPSIKMTTLHHFRCPLTRVLSLDDEIEFSGIIIDGVSERYDDKIFTAKRTADIAEAMQADGAIVAIDGWGNHHIDFVSVIEQLGKRNIPSVGLSYLGTQGRLVCSNRYVDCVIDFNKNSTGFESCVVGQNNLDEYDAYKAAALIKNKIKKTGKSLDIKTDNPQKLLHKLIHKTYHISEVCFGNQTSIKQGRLRINNRITENIVKSEPTIRNITVSIIKPGQHNIFVNSNLDFFPIACKVSGDLGTGVTKLLSGVTVMLTGVEHNSRFQPSNIGSSEGILNEQMQLDTAGTPSSDDYILHIDILFEKGEGRTAEGIIAAHKAADAIVQETRNILRVLENESYTTEEFYDRINPSKRKVVLVKIVSGLGNMYDTVLFPNEPCGIIGAHNIRECSNNPFVITPNQCRDGVIHSLL